jgi:hypothetical protein
MPPFQVSQGKSLKLLIRDLSSFSFFFFGGIGV